MKVAMERADLESKTNQSKELCKGEIPGASVVYHTIGTGTDYFSSAPAECYRIFVLLGGAAVFSTDGYKFDLNERATLVPAPDKDLLVTATSDTQVLEIRWNEKPGDKEILDQYQTKFPIMVVYRESMQYTEACKSEKTISRMMIPQEVLPRFSIGSVETYGYDCVQPHSHPALDQFFFSFPENDMELIIDGEKINMKGNTLVHIPLGSYHGVEVTGDRHLHYIWIDCMENNDDGVNTLKNDHIPSETVREFSDEVKP